MADYWKSQAKKFCDFCKCWIADNKPSIGFHESGKRHKENVAKRISEIRKNSVKSYQEEVQVDQEMKKMEEEALKAYMKDLQENPDYTSKKILEETERRKQELKESVKQTKGSEESQEAKGEESQTVSAASTSKVWYEAKSDEGYTYYWNTNTAESKWEPPEEGFVSIKEQELQKEETKLKEEIKRKKKEEKAKRKQEEIRAFKERENFKKKRKNENKDDEKEIEADVQVGPAPKPDPYGGWTIIEPKIDEPLDLELPQQEFVAVRIPELTEPEVKFKEKTFSSLKHDESEFGAVKRKPEGGFKKRKLNRGNMRQKLDTD
ncbi:WW domain-binding protein 4-like isoform X2 [Homalodisca vitripennis]|uniref:WW domain-binding protein 4-like isoform X2 n=1 Tax=Homalodisca vitripennis TaxID=197043 RepID=UPI001EEA27A8|nr:WW domain-binding protein 4-like isoform X2 [Homalodisca vitripennis]